MRGFAGFLIVVAFLVTLLAGIGMTGVVPLNWVGMKGQEADLYDYLKLGALGAGVLGLLGLVIRVSARATTPKGSPILALVSLIPIVGALGLFGFDKTVKDFYSSRVGLTAPAMPDTPPDKPDTPPDKPDTPPDKPDTPPDKPDTPPVKPDTPPDKPDTPAAGSGADALEALGDGATVHVNAKDALGMSMGYELIEVLNPVFSAAGIDLDEEEGSPSLEVVEKLERTGHGTRSVELGGVKVDIPVPVLSAHVKLVSDGKTLFEKDLPPAHPAVGFAIDPDWGEMDAVRYMIENARATLYEDIAAEFSR